MQIELDDTYIKQQLKRAIAKSDFFNILEQQCDELIENYLKQRINMLERRIEEKVLHEIGLRNLRDQIKDLVRLEIKNHKWRKVIQNEIEA